MTETDTTLRPVTDHENREARGLARCAASIFESEQAKVAELRARQAAYEASLPREPADRIKAARRLLAPGHDSYPKGFEEARCLAHAIAAMVRRAEDDAPCPTEHAAAMWIAERLTDRLEALADDLDRVGDILREPGSRF